MHTIHTSPSSHIALQHDTGCISENRMALQCFIKMARRSLVQQLPPLREIYRTRCCRKATNICRDPIHPCRSISILLLSGSAPYACMTKLKNSFCQQWHFWAHSTDALPFSYVRIQISSDFVNDRNVPRFRGYRISTSHCHRMSWYNATIESQDGTTW